MRKHDKNVHDTISYTVYNCPNTEKYWVNKIHIGRGEYRARWSRARYEFYWPDIFRIRTIVHCLTNVSWFCNQTSYLMFSILGQWIYHDFESIQPCILLTYFISSFSFPWDMEFVMVLSLYFTSDSIFFHIMTINLSCFCIHIIKFNIKSTV